MTIDDLKKSEHYHWVDVLRFVSVLLVITIHASSSLVYKWGEVRFRDFMVGNIYDSFARVSVPVFFMLSGYLLLNKQESIMDFYKKRAKKVLIPFIAWSLIYLFWDGYVINNGDSLLSIVGSVSLEILSSPAFGHLWFIYALLGVYLFVPVLRLFVSAAKKTDLWYIAGIWFFTGPIISALDAFFGITISHQFGFITGYFGYFLLGYLLSRYDYPKGQAISFLLFYLILSVATAVGIWYFSSQEKRIFLYLYNYLAPNIVLMSAAFFIFFLYWGKKMQVEPNSRTASFLKLLGETSFGVFLIHGIIQVTLKEGYFGFELSYKTGNPLVFIPLAVFTTYLISLFIVILLRKVPVARSTV